MVCGYVRGNEPGVTKFHHKEKIAWNNKDGMVRYKVFRVPKRDTSSSAHVSFGIVQLGF